MPLLSGALGVRKMTPAHWVASCEAIATVGREGDSEQGSVESPLAAHRVDPRNVAGQRVLEGAIVVVRREVREAAAEHLLQHVLGALGHHRNRADAGVVACIHQHETNEDGGEHAAGQDTATYRARWSRGC